MARTIINIVSGKGGTGKTLLACVLADLLGNQSTKKVVVVDLDFFVRGLTSLLYFHSDERLHLTRKDQLPVASYFIDKSPLNTERARIALLKYRSFEVVPAVSRIDERLNFQDIGPDTKDQACHILGKILKSIPEEYEYIILDSRAGYDELIAATHELSDVSLCVEEPDPISKVTADNLIAQLSADSQTPIFRLTNKARASTIALESVRKSRSVDDLGDIPFDMDIMNSFGSPRFWDELQGSLYRWALVAAWNRLAQKLELDVTLRSERKSPLVSETVEARVGVLGSKERVLFVYGIVVAISGLLYGILGKELLDVLREDPTRMAALATGAFGALISLYAFLRKRR
ncbi:Iron-sulfur cluster carrier protein [Burkholderia gladioli]|nr:Iron-sulfur cluster carrier protein [Burkholderia gladioli]KAF1061655.1 Iron-sulfur cluster carrier protein [Burkholderia gladioli]